MTEHAAMDADTLLSGCDPAVAQSAQALRQVLFEALPGIEETVDAGARLIGYGYGPGYKGLIATIILSKKGVKLGLARGAALPDPEGLLAGAGKVHRHVEMASPEAARHAGVRTLIEAAREMFEASRERG